MFGVSGEIFFGLSVGPLLNTGVERGSGAPSCSDFENASGFGGNHHAILHHVYAHTFFDVQTLAIWKQEIQNTDDYRAWRPMRKPEHTA